MAERKRNIPESNNAKKNLLEDDEDSAQEKPAVVPLSEKDRANLVVALDALTRLQSYLPATAEELHSNDMLKDAIGFCVVLIGDSIKSTSYEVQNSSGLNKTNAWWLRIRQVFAHKYSAVNWTRAFNDLTAEGRISKLLEDLKTLVN